MKAKPVSPHSQRSFLYPDLIDQLTPKDPLLLLAKKSRRSSWKMISLLCQVERNQGKRPKVAYCDRGFRGRKERDGTRIEIPQRTPKEKTEHYKRKARKKFRRRSALEGINSHLKFDFRMLRNFLKGVAGDTINLLMASAASNFKKWMRASALKFFVLFFASLFWLKDEPCYEHGGLEKT